MKGTLDSRRCLSFQVISACRCVSKRKGRTSRVRPERRKQDGGCQLPTRHLWNPSWKDCLMPISQSVLYTRFGVFQYWKLISSPFYAFSFRIISRLAAIVGKKSQLDDGSMNSRPRAFLVKFLSNTEANANARRHMKNVHRGPKSSFRFPTNPDRSQSHQQTKKTSISFIIHHKQLNSSSCGRRRLGVLCHLSGVTNIFFNYLFYQMLFICRLWMFFQY